MTITSILVWVLQAMGAGVIGAVFYSWWKDTRVGIWFNNRVDATLDWIAKTMGFRYLIQDDRYNRLPVRVDKLEERISKLESQENI